MSITSTAWLLTCDYTPVSSVNGACSWMHGVPNARAQVPMETFQRSKWNGGLGRDRPVAGERIAAGAERGTDRLGSVGGPFGARPWVSDGGQVGEQVRCFGFLGGTTSRRR
jgi:hypothetical protein